MKDVDGKTIAWIDDYSFSNSVYIYFTDGTALRVYSNSRLEPLVMLDYREDKA